MTPKSLVRTLTKLAAAAFVAATLGTSANAQVVIATDNASNYPGGNWTTGSNGGTGFGPWTINANNNPPSYFAGAFIGNPASANITVLADPSFGLYANPANTAATVTVSRSFGIPMRVGDSFSFQWATNFDSGSGNKGFNIFAGADEIANVNQGVFPGDITLNGANTNIAYGTGPMTWTFTRTSETNLEVTSSARDGSTTIAFSANITLSSAPTGFSFYSTAMDAGDNRQPYFNNFQVTGDPIPEDPPTITSAASANGTAGTAFSYQTTVTPLLLTTYNATGLPSGLSMNSATGLISGTPSASGNSSVTIVATNSNGSSANFTLALAIAPPEPPTVTSPWVGVTIPGANFTYQVVVAPSGVPTTFSATGLPSGLSIDTNTGLISGNAISAGGNSSNITVTNESGSNSDFVLYIGVGNAADTAANYADDNWTDGSNLSIGTGFGAWSFTSNSGTGSAGTFLGNPALAGISELPEISFGLFANPEDSGALIEARRDLSSPLAVGETLSFDWGINFDSNSANGSKRIVVYVGDEEAIRVENTNTSNITVNGQDTGFTYGTTAMYWGFTQISENKILVFAEPRNWDNENFSMEVSTNGTISAVMFYAKSLASGSERQPYFNNFLIMPDQGPSPSSYSDWASDYGLDTLETTGPTAGSPEADPDSDGFTNWQEYAFGTNPTEATAGLVSTSHEGGNLIVRFLTRDNLAYMVQTTNNLATTPFEDNMGISIVDGPTDPAPPTGYIRKQFTITPTGNRNFYRVIAMDQPPG